MSSKLDRLNRALSYSFYALFAITPLLMFPSTYEIFEFNKMWFVFGIAILIAFLWSTKMVLTQKIIIKRTPLDIPILIFLAAQIIATYYSIDPYVSWWGYYSRFNGGLLSTITYIFLYFALTTHLYLSKDGDNNTHPLSIKILLMSIFGGILVALWGLPSHFGYDPTCLIFGRGISTECWTDAFKPTIRIFSTLGQPNWLAAFLAALIPLAIAFAALVSSRESKTLPFMEKLKMATPQRMQIFFTLTTILFFIDLLYTRSKSGYVGLWVGLATMLLLYFIPLFYQKKFDLKKITMYPTRQTVLGLIGALLLLTFIIGVPIEQIEKFTLQGLIEKTKTTNTQNTPSVQNPVTGDAFGGTDSGNIRLIVWEGGVDMVNDYPLFGTGPETFGYAYYQYRPTSHNLTSEWDYLYNKAHNEYLNYAATSGLVGLITYLAIIIVFLTTAIWAARKKSEYKILCLALVASYISILVSNFFGFSVVNTNLALFLIPAFFYAILTPNNKQLTLLRGRENDKLTSSALVLIIAFGIIALVFELKLLRMWSADKDFALGTNLNKVGEVVQANTYLENAVKVRPQEDLFKNELALNLAYLAYASQMQNLATQASQLAIRSDEMSREITSKHPKNIVFYKNRALGLSQLEEVNPEYLVASIDSLRTAKSLAPTDAKISYNVAISYGRVGMYDEALKEFDNTTTLKPDYRNAYYYKALVAITAAKNNPEKAEEYSKAAKDSLTYILENISKDDTEAKELLISLN